MIGPFEFSNPERVAFSAGTRVVAISVWDRKGELHEFVARPANHGESIWLGTREDYETERP